MEYLIIAICVILAIVLIGAIKAQHDAKLRLIERLKTGYGKERNQEYTAERFESIKFYFKKHNDGVADVDDITVNDLNLDTIFIFMNNTCSSAGEECLYSMLRKPERDESVLKERHRIAEFFDKNADIRLKVQLMLTKLGRQRSISLYEYLNRLNNAPTDSNLFHFLFLFGYVASAGLMVAGAITDSGMLGAGIGLLVFTISAAIITYFKSKAEKDIYYNVILNVIDMIQLSKEADKLDSEELKPYVKNIHEAAAKLAPLARFSFIFTSKGGNIMDILLDYVRMLTHLDLVKFNNVIKVYRQNTDTINVLFENYGFLDSMIALASFRCLIKDWSVPEFSTDLALKVEELYHPLLEDPIKNSIDTASCVLLTGSNASGKSTFIKALAINSILAETVYTSTAKSYRAPFFKVMSSMALRDDLSGGESYYMVEIKSLKRIIDAVTDDLPVLCFVDEVLRGTNTLERISASSRILSYLGKRNCLVFAATHDLELASVLKRSYASYHFSEKIGTEDVEFDYLLKPGKADSRNAIRLLEKLGYPEEVTKEASEAARYFLEHNSFDEAE